MKTLISRKYSKGQYANQTLNFPVIGNATFDANGHLSVEDDKVEALMLLTEQSFDFEVEGAPKKVVKTKNEVVGKLKNKKVDEYVNPTNPEDVELKELLEAAKDKDLLEMAGEAGLEPSKAAAMSTDKLRRALFDVLKVKQEA